MRDNMTVRLSRIYIDKSLLTTPPFLVSRFQGWVGACERLFMKVEKSELRKAMELAVQGTQPMHLLSLSYPRFTPPHHAVDIQASENKTIMRFRFSYGRKLLADGTPCSTFPLAPSSAAGFPPSSPSEVVDDDQPYQLVHIYDTQEKAMAWRKWWMDM